MISLLIVIAAALYGGLAYRARGGGVATGSTQANRLLFWALPCGSLVGMLTLDPWLAAAVFPLAWASLLCGHAAHQAIEIGHLGDGRPGHYAPRDGRWYELLTKYPLRWVWGDYDLSWRYAAKRDYHLTGLAIVGAARGAAFLPLLAVTPCAWLPALAGAVAHPAAYWAGWRWAWPSWPLLRGATEWAEFLFGAALIGAASAALVWGAG